MGTWDIYSTVHDRKTLRGTEGVLGLQGAEGLEVLPTCCNRFGCSLYVTFGMIEALRLEHSPL